ncbi:tumor necrosis factor alpha-induced protein 2 [Lithobates pipiens]
MKKIRIKMATVAPVQTENIPEDGTNNRKKKKWYKKFIGKLIPPIWPVQSPGKEEKEITIEDVQKLIEEQHYAYASEGLIELEHKIVNGLEEPTLHMKELEPLYEKLKAEVFRVIKNSITSTDQELLQEAIQAIVEQESEDSKCIPDLINEGSSRPKGWMQTWKECIRQTVEERIQDLPQGLPQENNLNGPPTIIFPIITIGKLFKDDLIHLVTHLKACYPENFDVCNTYAQHYHQHIKIRTEEIAQFELCEKDNFAVLCWVQNLYPNEILKNPKLADHIDDSRLEALLSLEVVRLLENNFLRNERDSYDEHMNKAINFEAELWKNEMEPKMLGPHYHSELQIDIIQCHVGSLRKAAEIRPELKDKLSAVLQINLYKILERYKKVFEEYIFFMEKSKTQNFYRETCITHLNCCLGLRKEERLRQGSHQCIKLLLRLEDNIYDALLQDFFVDIKNNFKKMSQGSSPFSYQTMQNIIRIAETFMEPFHTLMDESYKVLSGKIHTFLVKEHLARILKRKVSYKSVQQMQTLATQIVENAELIDSFSVFYRSGEDWLKPALPKVAEIIRLQDLNAIQLEVATLVAAYPDIRNKQIEAILYMKGNLSRNEVKSILKTADMVERTVNDNQKLFESIKPS